MSNGTDQPAPPVADRPSSFKQFRDPVVVIAMAILLAIFFLIGAAIIDRDKGHVLTSMSQVEFARGLITYLFAVVTIGTAVVLVVSALTAEESPAHEKRFERGKEILSLLLGVFGTIVGFYFGSEAAAKGQGAQETIVHVAPIRLTSGTSPASVTAVSNGAEFILSTYASGGKAPYRYGVGFDKDDIKAETPVDANGWIVKTVTAPKVNANQTVQVRLLVEDADRHSAEYSVPVQINTGPK